MYINNSDILRFLKLIWLPGEVRELRILTGNEWETYFGYFDDPNKMAESAAHWSGQGKVKGVYSTLNPVKPEALARSANNTKRAGRGETTKDHEVARRRLLLLDFDPLRMAGISATDEERAEAIDRAVKCRDFLTELGFPAPITGDSGNGGHLVYRIDLDNTDAATALVKGVLLGVKSRFDDNRVSVDDKVFNAGRISKLYGTMTRKGDDTADRPHRVAKIIDAPERLEVVPVELLQRVAALASQPGDRATNPPGKAMGAATKNLKSADESVAWVEDFITKHSIPITDRKEGGAWACRWVVKRCPLCGESDESAVVTVSADGIIGYGCQHNRCKAVGWDEYREHYDPKAGRRKGGGKGGGDDLSYFDRALEAVGRAGWELWHDGTDAYVSFRRDDHVENHRVGAGGMTGELMRLFLSATGRGLPKNVEAEVVNTLKARALTEGKRYAAHLRVARHEDKVFIDIGGADWSAVEVSSGGWKVIPNPPVKFIRTATTGELYTPERGGSVGDFLDHFNVSPDQLPKLVGLLCDAWKGVGDYFVGGVQGEQGTAKSGFCERVVRLIDPQVKGETSAAPKCPEDVYVIANAQHLVCFDNVSYLSDDVSDAVCRLATGAGYRTRELYTNAGLCVLSACRPVLMNGITAFISRPDLLDRAMLFTLSPLDTKLTKRAAWKRFDKAGGKLVGVILDHLAAGLASDYDTEECDYRMSGAMSGEQTPTKQGTPDLPDLPDLVYSVELSRGYQQQNYTRNPPASWKVANPSPVSPASPAAHENKEKRTGLEAGHRDSACPANVQQACQPAESHAGVKPDSPNLEMNPTNDTARVRAKPRTRSHVELTDISDGTLNGEGNEALAAGCHDEGYARRVTIAIARQRGERIPDEAAWWATHRAKLDEAASRMKQRRT